MRKLQLFILRFIANAALAAAIKVLDFLIERDHKKSHKYRYVKGGYGVYDDRANKITKARNRLARSPPK